MADRVPVLIGASGLVTGETFALTDGQAVVIGRSRSCDISLQKVRRYLEMDEITRTALIDFNAVSRQHLRVCVTGTAARLENLSPSGTSCDGARFDQGKQVDLAGGAVNLRLSPSESFNLMLIDAREVDSLMAKTRPMLTDATTRMVDTTPRSAPILRIPDGDAAT